MNSDTISRLCGEVSVLENERVTLRAELDEWKKEVEFHRDQKHKACEIGRAFKAEIKHLRELGEALLARIDSPDGDTIRQEFIVDPRHRRALEAFRNALGEAPK